VASLRLGEVPEGFRRCPVTGLLCHIPSQRLIVANFAMALISLAIGGVAAFFVGLSRSSLILVKSPESYYMWLTAHGVNMLIFWILWFEVALLYFTATVLLNSPLYSVRAGWLAFAVMLLGWAIIEVLVFTGRASVLFTAYPPLKAHPLFYVGYLLFAVGVLIAVIVFFLTLYKARRERRYEGSLPLVTFGAAIAGIIALTVIFHGAVTLLYILAYVLGYLSTINLMFVRWYFWGFGHDAQYVNAVAMVAVWYALLTLATGFAAARFVNEKYARFAFILYTIFIVPGIGHHILVDPGFSEALKQASGSVGSHFLSVPSMLHAFALLGGLEALLRASGHTGLLGWLLKIPWRNPGVAGLLLSMILFGLGGIVAQPQTTLQPNLMYHNTMWVPAHFHLTVVGGTTLAFMAISYYIVPLLTLRRLWSVRLALAQLYLGFIGILVMSLSMLWLGYLGAPRRTLLLEDLVRPEWWTPMSILGVGALLWITSGALFIALMILTLAAGRRTESREELVEGLIDSFQVREDAKPHKKGTLLIVFALLFVVMLSVYFHSFLRLKGMPEIW
jgi:cytochrome c oxidase subunit 1